LRAPVERVVALACLDFQEFADHLAAFRFGKPGEGDKRRSRM
jgi:hypothetical protein